ncbi:MAG TPA: NUDIX domain-containing protein [Alphaproteobacteria bacterium]|nr:NUDIX domain-containing protein [Alphaproteobacteria bacterium]
MANSTFLDASTPLQVGDAVAAILVLEDGRYVLQLRDDVPEIWYPGHWGCFGGGVDPAEEPRAALRRELREELELEFDVAKATLFTRFEFDLRPTGLGRYYRAYYEIALGAAAFASLKLHEGAELRAWPRDEALALPRLSPYDAFALFLHAHRHRLPNAR